MTKEGYIELIAPLVQKYAPMYGICVCSPIIAQGVIEGWNNQKKALSTLAAKYNNFHGLKCGSKWTGKAVNLKTMEEYTVGVKTSIQADFRAYDSVEEGIKGYFEFLQLKRYENLKGITSPEEYLKTIKADGYATSSTYVESCMAVLRQYDLTKYDAKEVETMGKYASKIVNLAKTWIGKNESDGSHKAIIDLYNSHVPLARNYKVKYTDSWCATTVSALAIKLGYIDIIPTECSCQKMIELFKKIGCWRENENYTPKPGDVIFYDWQDNGSGDNTGWSDHVGIVEKVSGGKITVIEGNYYNSVKRRRISVNGKYIRGYGVPKYDSEVIANNATTKQKSIDEIANEVIAGKWGSGDARKQKLLAAGYDPAAVQVLVNQLLSKTSYYGRYTGTSTQIDVVLRKIGVPDIYVGNKMKRKPLAMANGYTNYNGKYSENLALIALAKKGKLKKV